MNPSLWSVLLWKELRLLGPVWLANTLLASISIQILGLSRASDDFSDESPGVIYLAMLTFAVAAGVICFAQEYEAGIDRWLIGRGLAPLPPLMIKLAIIAIGGLSLLGLLVGQSWFIDSVHVRFGVLNGVLQLVILAFFVFSQAFFWSVLTGQALAAAAIGLASLFVTMVLVSAIIDMIAYTYNVPSSHSILMNTGLVIHLALLTAGIGLYHRRWRRIHSSGDVAEKLLGPTVEGSLAPPGSPAIPFLSIGWKEWRRAKPLLLGMALFLAALAVEEAVHIAQGACVPSLAVQVGAVLMRTTEWRRSWAQTEILPYGFGFLAFVMLLVSFLAGIASFADDRAQKTRRLLHHRGLMAGSVWLPKILLWGLAPLLASLVLGLVLISCAAPRILPHERFLEPPRFEYSLEAARQFALIAPWGTFAVGVLASLLFQQFVVALAVGVFACLFVTTVAVYIPLLGDIPALIVALSFAGLLLISYRPTSNWLREREGWLPWFQGVAWSSLPLIAGYVAINSYRAVEPGAPIPAELRPKLATVSPEQNQTLYSLSEILLPMGRDHHLMQVQDPHVRRDELRQNQRKILLERHRERLEPLLAAIQGPLADLTNPETPPEFRVFGNDVAIGFWLLNAGAEESMAQGNFPQALERILAMYRLIDHAQFRADRRLVIDRFDRICFELTLEADDSLDSYMRLAQPTPESFQSTLEYFKQRAFIRTSTMREQILAEDRTMRDESASAYERWIVPSPGDLKGRLAYYLGGFVVAECERIRRDRIIDRILEARLRWLEQCHDAPFDQRAFASAENLYSDELKRQFFLTADSIGVGFFETTHSLPLEWNYEQERWRLVHLAKTLWEVEHHSRPPTSAEACEKYLGGVPVNPFSGERLIKNGAGTREG